MLPIALFLFFSSREISEKQKPSPQIAGGIVPPPAESYDVNVISIGTNKKHKKKQHKKPKTDCKAFYGGVGVTISELTGRIIQALPQYPAHRAGLRVDDVIINDASLRGTIGESVEIHYLRNGEEFIVTIVREKICTEDVGNKP